MSKTTIETINKIEREINGFLELDPKPKTIFNKMQSLDTQGLQWVTAKLNKKPLPL